MWYNSSRDTTDGALNPNKRVGISTGTTPKEIQKIVDYFTENYNLDIDYNAYSDLNIASILDLYNIFKEKKIDNIVLSCSDFDLYNLDGSICSRDVGAHAMYVIDTTKSGDLIVSSWGKKYIVDISSIKGFIRMQTFS